MQGCAFSAFQLTLRQKNSRLNSLEESIFDLRQEEALAAGVPMSSVSNLQLVLDTKKNLMTSFDARKRRKAKHEKFRRQQKVVLKTQHVQAIARYRRSRKQHKENSFLFELRLKFHIIESIAGQWKL